MDRAYEDIKNVLSDKKKRITSKIVNFESFAKYSLSQTYEKLARFNSKSENRASVLPRAQKKVKQPHFYDITRMGVSMFPSILSWSKIFFKSKQIYFCRAKSLMIKIS